MHGWWYVCLTTRCMHSRPCRSMRPSWLQPCMALLKEREAHVLVNQLHPCMGLKCLLVHISKQAVSESSKPKRGLGK
jgi:hypothetical protein